VAVSHQLRMSLPGKAKGYRAGCLLARPDTRYQAFFNNLDMYLGENPGKSILLMEKVSQVISLQGLVVKTHGAVYSGLCGQVTKRIR